MTVHGERKMAGSLVFPGSIKASPDEHMRGLKKHHGNYVTVNRLSEQPGIRRRLLLVIHTTLVHCIELMQCRPPI